MNNLHPVIAASLAHWMPKPSQSRMECAQAATDFVVPSMADQLRDEHATGLDAVDLPEGWEPGQ